MILAKDIFSNLVCIILVYFFCNIYFLFNICNILCILILFEKNDNYKIKLFIYIIPKNGYFTKKNIKKITSTTIL